MTKEELGKLIISSEDAMYHIGMSLLCNEADVEDAVQTSIVKAFEQLGSLKKDRYAKTWLTRILINECKDMLRRRRFLSQEEIPEQTYEESFQDYSALYRALLTLPEDTRITILLYYADGYTIREIAGILNLPEGTVKSRLSRAKKALRKEMKRMEVCYG